MNITQRNLIWNGEFGPIFHGTVKLEKDLERIPVALRTIQNNQGKSELLNAHYFTKYLAQDPKSVPFFSTHRFIGKFNNCVALITDIASGSIEDFLNDPNSNCTLREVAIVVKSIAGALAFLEKEKIIYPHLDPQKILYFKNRQEVKLECFGQIYFKDEGCSFSYLRRSRSYASPLSLLGYESTFKTPIWPLAQIAKQLFTKVMYKSNCKEELFASFRSLIGEASSEQMRRATIYQDSKNKKPENDEPLTALIRRVALGRKEDSEKAEQFLDLLLKMFKYEDPISAEEILFHPFLSDVSIHDHTPSFPTQLEISDNFKNVGALGSGSFGTVYSADLRLNGQSTGRYAVKCSTIQPDNKIHSDDLKSFLNEDRVLRFLARDPESAHYIVKREAFLRTNEQMKLVLELARSNLKEYRETITNFSLADLKRISRHLFEALDFLCKNEVIHLDIKPQNILIREDGTPILADFGCSCFHESTTHLDSYVITRWYRPPEIVLKIPFTAAADVWSLGATLIETLIKRGAFQATSANELIQYHHIRLGRYPVSLMALTQLKAANQVPFIAGRKLSDFIKGSWPHEDTKSFINFVTKALTLDPNQRPSAEDLLKEPFLRNEEESCENSDSITA